MPRPVTPIVGCDVSVLNSEDKVLLIRRADNDRWALPGGAQNLGETPVECAERECLEESGYRVKVIELLGVFSSIRYPYVFFPWKDLEICHVCFRAKLLGGEARISDETTAIGWYGVSELPALSDGHELRITFGFKKASEPSRPSFFE